MTGRWYVVQSPTYLYTEPVLDWGEGPTSEERDVIYVFARNTNRAKALALRTFRRQFGRKMNRGYLRSDNPFSGMKAERCDEIPPTPFMVIRTEGEPVRVVTLPDSEVQTITEK